MTPVMVMAEPEVRPGTIWDGIQARFDAADVLGYTQRHGGCTYDVALHTPHVPTAGYAVSLPGTEELLRERSVDAVADYIDRHAAQLGGAVPDADGAPRPVFLGTWDEDGALVMDLSIVVPHKETALALGMAWGQRSVYDFGADTVVPVGARGEV